MEKNTHTPRPLHLAQAEPLLRERLKATVVLTVTGGSMLPLLAGGRDRVTLGPVPERLRRGEVLLYHRADGSYVLHRLTGFGQDGTLVFCGDRQTEPERGDPAGAGHRAGCGLRTKRTFFYAQGARLPGLLRAVAAPALVQAGDLPPAGSPAGERQERAEMRESL